MSNLDLEPKEKPVEQLPFCCYLDQRDLTRDCTTPPVWEVFGPAREDNPHACPEHLVDLIGDAEFVAVVRLGLIRA